MTDAKLMTVVRKSLIECLPLFGIPEGFEVVRAYNRTQQGRIEAPVIYMSRAGTRAYGMPRDYSLYDKKQLTTVYINETTYITKLRFQSMANAPCVYQLNAEDMNEIVVQTLNSSYFDSRIRSFGVRRFKAEGGNIGGAGGTTFVENDRGQFEPVPLVSVDFTYTKMVKTEVNKVDRIEGEIRRV